MAHSINKHIYTGQTDFDLSFSGGYRVRDDVSCYREGPVRSEVTFNWLTDSRVRIVPTSLTIGDEIHFVRTVSKLEPPVDIMQPNNFTREAVVAAVKHTLQALQEVIDGRIDSFTGDLITALELYVERAETASATVTTDAERARIFAERAESAAYTGEGNFLYATISEALAGTRPSVAIDPVTLRAVLDDLVQEQVNFAQEYTDIVNIGGDVPSAPEGFDIVDIYRSQLA